MKPRQNAVTKLMNEVAIYGGIPMRRADILALCTEHIGSCPRAKFGPQWFALHGPSVELEPWTLDEARKIMQS